MLITTWTPFSVGFIVTLGNIVEQISLQHSLITPLTLTSQGWGQANRVSLLPAAHECET